jgi:NNP family nitrate/nitrite transporter-like MFS transporter
MNRGFLKTGHLPTLVAAFLYFDLSFMVWVLLGPLGVAIAHELRLDAAQKGLMVAVPVLAGALLRIACGLSVDRFGARSTAIAAQLLVILGLAGSWGFGVRSFAGTLALGIVLGLAGASFAIALPLASRWYPPQHQGTALGIAGAGNSGTVLAALLAPGLAVAFGWQNVFGLAAIVLAATLAVFAALARESPNRPPGKAFRDYLAMLEIADAWWLMFFYAVTFGGFVGLASSLTIYFNVEYGLGAVSAGYFTAACVFAGSLIRPLGGAIADRIGGVRLLSLMYLVAAAALATVSIGLPDPMAALAVFVVAMLALGMGNGAVFQLAPQRFGREIGVITGLVGMSGGLGGFYLASSLGYAKQLTGSYRPGFLVFAGLAAAALIGLAAVKRRWRASWGAAGALRGARI